MRRTDIDIIIIELSDAIIASLMTCFELHSKIMRIYRNAFYEEPSNDIWNT